MIKPLGNCVIIKVKDDGVNEFGIKTESTSYEVIACGAGLKTKNGVIPVDLKSGDIVFVKNDDMIDMSINNEAYFSTTEDNVMMIAGG